MKPVDLDDDSDTESHWGVVAEEDMANEHNDSSSDDEVNESDDKSDDDDDEESEPGLFDTEAIEINSDDDDDDDDEELRGYDDTDLDTDDEDNDGIYPTQDGPETFHPFPKLPAELRLRIWELFCPLLLQPMRVFPVELQENGKLGPTMILTRHFRPLRRFMKISHETRARGLQTVPDELPIGTDSRMDSVVRFNARVDIVYIALDSSGRLRPRLYEHIRNFAMIDRLERPGGRGFHDNVDDTGTATEDEASHRQPVELRCKSICESLDRGLPNLENFYVVEDGNERHKRWIGCNDCKQYEIHTYEKLLWEHKASLDYIYCWHEPPKRKRPTTCSDVTASLPNETGGTDETNGAEKEERRADGSSDDGKFKEEAVISHISAMANRGVRFSRMILFELDEGLRQYYGLQSHNCPGGGLPMKEDDPFEADASGDESEPDEYESSGIDDDEIMQSVSSDSGDEDDLLVDGNSDSDSDAEGETLAVGNFSSPEPETDTEAGTANTNSRGKKRRIVSDSDDDESDNGKIGTNGRSHSVDAAGGSRKRRRRAILADEDEDEDVGYEGKEDKKNGKAGPSTNGEDSEDDEEDSEEEDASHTEGEEDDSKPLSLMARLQRGRELYPLDNASGSEEEDNDASDGAEDEFGGFLDESAEEDEVGEGDAGDIYDNGNDSED